MSGSTSLSISLVSLILIATSPDALAAVSAAKAAEADHAHRLTLQILGWPSIVQ